MVKSLFMCVFVWLDMCLFACVLAGRMCGCWCVCECGWLGHCFCVFVNPFVCMGLFGCACA